MKPFSLDEYLKNPSKKVITRDGHNVRIICTDHDNVLYPIVGAIKGYDFPFCFSEDGCVVGSKCNDANDLFFAPVKHEGCFNIYHSDESGFYVRQYHPYKSKDEADEIAKANHRTFFATVRIEWEE